MQSMLTSQEILRCTRRKTFGKEKNSRFKKLGSSLDKVEVTWHCQDSSEIKAVVEEWWKCIPKDSCGIIPKVWDTLSPQKARKTYSCSLRPSTWCFGVRFRKRCSQRPRIPLMKRWQLLRASLNVFRLFLL